MALKSFYVWESDGDRPARANVRAWDGAEAATTWVESCWSAIDSPKTVRVFVEEVGTSEPALAFDVLASMDVRFDASPAP